MLKYSEVIVSQGIRIPFVPEIITPKIERPLRNGRYEGGECAALRSILRPGDRVLELGAGLGLLSSVSASVEGIQSVTAIEANPDLIPLIRETHSLNGLSNVDLRNGVVTAENGDDIAFYIRPDFWASSMEPGSRAYSRVETLRRFALGDLLEELQPTVVVSDIEGGELGLFDHVDLTSVRAMVVEFHPKVYGEAGQERIVALLAAKGLTLAEANQEDSSVQLFERRDTATAKRGGDLSAKRSFRSWPIADPRVFVATCMKDEGPFILEWLAWHKSIGVTDVVVFTNDCSDGTDRLLDRLQDLGELMHLPNPALATGDTAYQPLALNYAQYLRPMREADFFISMDVDEFINIRAGEGYLSDLFAAAGPFDVLSMTEVNHGANRREHYQRGWLTEQFPAHQSDKPGVRKSRRGIKSIVRLSHQVDRLRNHRPDMGVERGPVLWLDGSGRVQKTLAADRSQNGLDCRGTYDLVRLEHFALRSLDSYLTKMHRGDVVVSGKRVSQYYWRSRNGNEIASGGYGHIAARAHAYHRTRFESDTALMDLHEACCVAHEARIKALLQHPDFAERRKWVLADAW